MRVLALTPLALCAAAALHAQDYSWPRQIPFTGATASGTIVLYQPQAEKLEGNLLTARGAIALKVGGTGTSEPIFGAMWMTATVDVDRDSGMVWLHDLKIQRVRWPDAKPEQQARFTEFVEKDFPTAGFRLTLERLQASLASADAQVTHTEGLKHDAPKLVFVEQLAVLLLYDGEPRLQAVAQTGLQVVVNTPFAVIRDTASGIYWLGAGDDLWYSATSPKGPWKAGDTPPAEILKRTQGDTAAVVAQADVPTTRPDTLFGPITVAPADVPTARPDTLFEPTTATPADTAVRGADTTLTRPDSAAARAAAPVAAPPTTPTPAPASASTITPLLIVTSTVPTELVVTQGPPTWKTTAGGKLLYVENTETPWLRETEGRDNYILITGRWFKSPSTAGPWSFQRPDSLPAAFQEIPAESPIGGVRNSIAMTPEAQDALLDLEIPQTTAVQRNATLAVKYDGAPKFTAIAGTKVSYATNTGSKVLLIGGAYYACDNAVWFKSFSAQGPWTVADSIPTAEIAKIPPSSPMYGLTYVHVYASTPEVVYVGYTPGYTGAYPYYGVPVYGTGYAYPPYVGNVYYPQPVTYGVAVSYNPYTGYGMGNTWATGFFAFSVGVAIGSSYRHGYYPAGGYRGCFNCTINVNRGSGGRGSAGRGGRNQANIGNTAAGGSRARPANRATQQPRNSNLYNRPENRARTADRSSRARASSQVGANRTARGSNNVFADRNGNVSRRGSSGWESRQGNSWSKDPGGARGGGSREREWQARQRSSSRSYGGGGSRGGGGGRRGGGGGGRRR